MGVYHLIRGAAVFPAALVGGILWDWLPAAPFAAGAAAAALGLVWFVGQTAALGSHDEVVL
jgi:hypothetical protein